MEPRVGAQKHGAWGTLARWPPVYHCTACGRVRGGDLGDAEVLALVVHVMLRMGCAVVASGGMLQRERCSFDAHGSAEEGCAVHHTHTLGGQKIVIWSSCLWDR